MLKKDKEVADRKSIDDIIRGAQVCRIALAVNNQPYIVPLSFGYDGEAIYFHTALEGLKIDMIMANPRVCFEFEKNVRLINSGGLTCNWSFSYESVIGFGTVQELTEKRGKDFGLQQILAQYSGRADWPFEAGQVDKTRVWKLTIESLTAKKS